MLEIVGIILIIYISIKCSVAIKATAYEADKNDERTDDGWIDCRTYKA